MEEKNAYGRWGIGCCAPVSSHEDLSGVHQVQGDRDISLTFEQPQRIPPPVFEPQNIRPVTAVSFGRTKSWFGAQRASSSDFARTRASRSSSITTVMRPWTSQSRTRPVIGAPTNFRRVTEPMEPMPTRRRSFRPLELSIYLPAGRISPLPDFESMEWDNKLVQLQRPQAAMVRRETLDNSELASEGKIRRKPLSILATTSSRRDVNSEPVILPENGPGPTLENDITEDPTISDLISIDENRTPTFTSAQLEEMAMATRSFASRNSAMRSPSPFSMAGLRSRSQTDINLVRKPSLRRSKTDTVDEAIRELNTIVEERRVKALSARTESESIPPSSPTTHVPAIAPRMQLRARSETLSSIGSAFSISYSHKPLPHVPAMPNIAASPRSNTISPQPGLSIITSPHTSSISTMSTALARLPTNTRQNPSTGISAKSRLSTWLKRSLPGSPVSPTAPQQEPFYQLTPPGTRAGLPSHPRKHSSSVSTFSSVSSLATSTTASYSDAAYTTPTTTIASPVTPAGDMTIPSSRPSLSKTPKTLRRMGPLKRGLSIDTQMSNGSALTYGPPAYQEEDPHPLSPLESPITPGRVGLAY